MTDGWGTPPVATIGSADDQPKFEVKYVGQPDTVDPEVWRAERNAKIQNWNTSKETATNATNFERELRSQVSKMLFPNPRKGTNKYDLGNGYGVKLTYILNYKLGDKDKVDESEAKISIETQIRAVEDDIIEKHGAAGEQVLRRLITWKPEISGSNYEKLDPNNEVELYVRNKISEVLTIEPAATPTLAFEEPKAS